MRAGRSEKPIGSDVDDGHLSRASQVLQFVKFGVVGLSNTAVNYGFYALFVFLDLPYLLANFLSFSISVVNSFIWNNRFTFRLAEGRSRVWWRAFIKSYLSYSVTGILLVSVLLWFFIDVCGISQYVAQLVTIPITVPINFALNKYWAYRAR